MTNRTFSRRNLLRGAGVALTLPWLESLAPKTAGAAVSTAPVRYMPIFLPNGAPDIWMPQTSGVGASWQLSSVLEPLAALKSKLSVISNLENGSAFNKDGSNSVEPSHGRQPGGWLTATDAATVQARLKVADANGVSLDQIMAAHPAFAGKTAVPSMQIGLSTVYSSCDGRQCSISRSVSWKTETQPLYKMVDPMLVFNTIVGATSGGGPIDDPDAARRLALKKSVLDTMLENAANTRKRLSKSDHARMDEYLTSVRNVEQQVMQVSTGMGGAACAVGTAPVLRGIAPEGIRQTTQNYNKGAHADAMSALIVLAFQCDVTRVLTYMLEDERSEFTYDHVIKRKFTPTGSTVSTGTCPEYHTGGQHGSADDFATITHWNVGKVAELCSKLDAIKEADGKSILDNSVILFGGCMHGNDHKADRLPTVLIGGGGGKLKTDQHLVLDKRPLRDLHYTVMNDVFGMQQTNFGQNLTGAPIAKIPQLLV